MQFIDMDKKLRIYNGNVGTITRLDPATGEITAQLDAAGRDGREEGMRNASRAASSGRSMTVPGVGREHQAGLDELARSFVQGCAGMAHSAVWEQRVEREAKEAERQRARAEDWERRGLPLEPEQDRERQRERRRLGLGR